MNVNATLIVQAGNFFLAYIILRVFLLKPLMRVIRQEEQQENAMASQIESVKKTITAQQIKRAELWNACQSYFVRQSPPLLKAEDAILRDITPDIEPKTLSESAMQDAIDKTADAIAQRVGGSRV